MDSTVPILKLTNGDQQDPSETAMHDMAVLLKQITTMETFIKRRFDEISMEINATSQQIDMSENSMAKRFGEILGVMNTISYSGDGTTAANTGVELEAVILETTKAATSILDTCDRLNAVLYTEDIDKLLSSPAGREKLLEEMRGGVQDIVLACAFHDVTGQRIRKTLESINDIENRITDALEGIGIRPEEIKAANADMTEKALKSGSTQADIDALFDD